jgi:glycerol dehydrogenase-like iron-containing ADH family enzyme
VASVGLGSLETDDLLQVFDAVAAELANQEIWVHLDNHVSKAQWCCGADDGNAWFGGEHTLADIWESSD